MLPKPLWGIFGSLKIVRRLVLGAAVFAVALVLARDPIIRTAIIAAGPSVLGAPVKLEKFSWGLLNQKIVIRDLKLMNPPGFEKEVFLDIPEAVLKYDLFTLAFKRKVHIPLAVFHVKEMTVIRNKDGKLNVDALKISPKKDTKKSTEQNGTEARVEIPPFQIDVLKLTVGQVILKDHTKGDPVPVLVYDVGLKDKTFKNLTSVPQLATVIIVQAMGPTAIKSAGIYAAGALMGVGFLPAGVLGVVVADDDSSAEFQVGAGTAFEKSLDFVKERGLVKKADKETGLILAKIEGYDVRITVEKLSLFKSKVTVSARRFFLAKREFAAGILYQISDTMGGR